MTMQDAVSMFVKEHPKLIPKMIIDYDDEHYIIEAVKTESFVDYNDPYYGIDKKSGMITNYYPAMDINRFFIAIQNRSRHINDRKVVM